MMAEKAAHLTATAHPKPSIFEIIAQDSLNSTIYPALQKVSLFLSSTNPKNFNWLMDYCDEVYLVINGIIQYYYIKKYDASFSEYFYGLKRISAIHKIDSFTERQQKLSLIFLVILPYLKIKLEEKLAIYRIELADDILLKDWKKMLKQILCSCHGAFHLSWTFWMISQYLMYMSGKLDTQTPILRMLALKLTYAEIEQENNSFWTFTWSKFKFGFLGHALTGSLEFGAFLLQFLQSWQKEKTNMNITSLPDPGPPDYEPKTSDYRGKCPLCHQTWKTPTLLSTSGFIYCFRCLMQHLRDSPTCPVTHLPANTEHMVRLYDK